jgi:hypothetical protein
MKIVPESQRKAYPKYAPQIDFTNNRPGAIYRTRALHRSEMQRRSLRAMAGSEKERAGY